MRALPPLGDTDIHREFRWAGAYLVPHLGKIRNFLDFSRTFQRDIFQNEFDSGSAAVDGIEAEFGQSLWLIKSRIALLQLWKGLDAQKQYTKQISELAPKSIQAFIAHYVSVRNEATVTPGRFSPLFNQHYNRAALGQQVPDG